ncbi:mitochondrial ribonuclease P protein 1 homolog [Dreissena polymorpha]|nr:mitochondrial ribonuclease P protein 1 homolog [Dreissena polymorpha]XP_052284505.1 mitochondrial ribonuclease P protein 1 homolog [Dreissena polymorpha]
MFASRTRMIKWKCSRAEMSKWCRQVFVLITRQFSSKKSQDDIWRAHDGTVLDKQYEEKKKTVEGFIEYLKENRKEVPDELTTDEWHHMLKSCDSFPEYRAYLRKLFQKHRDQSTDTSQINGLYGLPNENQYYLSKYIQGVNSGRRVIIDLNYDYCDPNHNGLLTQCLIIADVNIHHRQPLHLNFTGLRRNTRVFNLFKSNSDFFTKTSDCFDEDFLSIFHPRKNLVYLSPHGRPMPDYMGDEIFVIGGLIDMDPSQRLSQRRAKELGIRCASFPQTRFHGRQITLKMQSVFRVLLDLNLGLTWQEALSKYISEVRQRKAGEPQEPFVITV